jgi:two-component system nitrogen regulation response regulator GlnG
MSDTARDILIVDDEPAICNLLARLIRKEGWCAEVAHSGLSALDAIHKAPPDLLLLDYRLPDMTGQDVMREARLILPELPVVVITAYASVQTAVDSMRAGAVDFLAKPFDHKKLLSIIHSTLARQEASLSPSAAHRLTSGGEIHSGLQDSMGPSRVIRELAQQVERVAASNFNVLLVGETGTGKELVSQAIHRSSSRRKGPFVPVDCGALPDQLLESELFGHEKGAFTGAVSRKPGKFELANGGTLFLDEISNLSWTAQGKLLRAIQERVIYRLGGTEPIRVDVRLIAACNQDLTFAAERGEFRSDLFFRLNEFMLRLPALRDRREDINHLAQRFLRETNEELGRAVQGFSAEAVERMHCYDWPGNVRQLRNVVRQAVLMADQYVELHHMNLLDPSIVVASSLNNLEAGSDKDWLAAPLKEVVRREVAQIERKILVSALRHTTGNKFKAAQLLCIDYKTLLNKVKEYSIDIGYN